MPTGYRPRFVLLAWLLVLAPGARAQHVELRSIIGKAVYFESEPIYVAWELTNTSSDTVWVPAFSVVFGNLSVVVLKDGSIPLSEHGLVADQAVTDAWRGVPIPPGGHLYDAAVLQVRWGDDPPAGTRLFRRHLPPGEYVLEARFAMRAEGMDISTVVEATPVSFHVRARSPAEDATVSRVEAIRRMPWVSGDRARSVVALVEWTDGRFRQDPSDPFLGFLLSYGLQTTAAASVPVDAATVTQVAALRRTVVLAQQAAPSAAVVIDAMSYDTTTLAFLAAIPSSSLASRVAKYHLARTDRRASHK